jgi:hypothetical protein
MREAQQTAGSPKSLAARLRCASGRPSGSTTFFYLFLNDFYLIQKYPGFIRKSRIFLRFYGGF